MTLIIGKKNKNNLIIAGDKKITGGFKGLSKDRKITLLGDTLIGVSGDTLSIIYIEELYNKWIEYDEGKKGFTSMLQLMKFYSYLKDNSNLKEPSFSIMYLNKHYQLIINSGGFIEHIGENGYIASGAGSLDTYTIIETLKHIGAEIPIGDMFKIVSKRENSVSEEYDMLKINL